MHNHEVTTLVLLPGLDGTGKLFKPFLSVLPLDVRTQVIVYPRDRLLSVHEYAEFVKSQLPPGRIILLAESFSGPVLLTLLSLLEKPVAAAIFCASFAEPPRPLLLRLAALVACTGPLLRSAPDFLLRRFCLGPAAKTEQLELARETLSMIPPKILAHRLKLLAKRHSFLKMQFRIPCYFLQATTDRLVPAKAVDWFRNHFENFQLEKLSGPHFLLQTKPQECARLATAIFRATNNMS